MLDSYSAVEDSCQQPSIEPHKLAALFIESSINNLPRKILGKILNIIVQFYTLVMYWLFVWLS